MKISILIITIIFCVAEAALAQNSWNLLTTQENALITEANTLGYVYFTDENNGWACGTKGMTGAIYKTQDGGKIWEEAKVTGGVFDSFSGMCFLEDGIIWAGGSKNTSGQCLLYKSIDGGINWTPYSLPENLGVRRLYFADKNEGWAILNKSGSSRIYHTVDGGENWTVQMDGTTSDGWTIRELFCCHFFDKNNAIAAGNYGFIIYTTDGGSTWNYRDSPISTQLWDIHFVDADYGWIVGGDGNLLYTTDGGVNWNKVSLGISQDLRNVYFIDRNNGWLVGGRSGTNQGIIYSSVDGGLTWTQENIASNRDLNYIFFLNNNSGWAVGNYGTVYHYGTATAVENLNELPNNFKLSQNYPNPFNPATTIQYSIPEFERNDMNITLKVYDMLGQEITTLVNEQKMPGNYQVTFNADGLASGVYYYRLQCGSFSESKKFVLMK